MWAFSGPGQFSCGGLSLSFKASSLAATEEGLAFQGSPRPLSPNPKLNRDEGLGFRDP